MSDNPFAVLDTAVVAPAILTNACSVLALGTGNRVARVVDRTRAITTELATIAKGTPLYENRVANIKRLRNRSQRLLLTALRIIYASCSEVSRRARSSRSLERSPHSTGTRFSSNRALAALAAGLSAVGGLVAGCIMMVAETRLALLGADEALEDALAGRPT